VAEEFSVRFDSQSGKVFPTMTPAQHQQFADALLARPLPDVERVSLEIPTPDGPISVEVAKQFVMDSITRPSGSFSVHGVSADGVYVPLTTSAHVEGDKSYVEGMYRVLLALYRLAGPDTPALTNNLTQWANADFLSALFSLGENSPLKLSDGRSVMPSGGGAIEMHLTRLADGSYEFKWASKSDPLETIQRIETREGEEELYTFPLDREQSYALVSTQVDLRFGKEGKEERKIIQPIDIRYHVVEKRPGWRGVWTKVSGSPGMRAQMGA
jgi:hypothetical protein